VFKTSTHVLRLSLNENRSANRYCMFWGRHVFLARKNAMIGGYVRFGAPTKRKEILQAVCAYSTVPATRIPPESPAGHRWFTRYLELLLICQHDRGELTRTVVVSYLRVRYFTRFPREDPGARTGIMGEICPWPAAPP
jgi:hypothetical protein